MSEKVQSTEYIVPLNLKAILDWCEAYRPDLRPVVWMERNNDGFILAMTTGFEAGRAFQRNRPDFPANGSEQYLAQSVVMVDGKTVTLP